MRRLVFLTTLFLSVLALPVHAQFVSQEPLVLSVSPQNPRPYDTVTITPTSNLVDLSAAAISVSVDGKVVEQGGVQSVPITVAGPGGATKVSVTAKVGGQSYSQSVTLRPADVALVVEPISTTHAWYEGAALTAPEGRVRIIAIPDLRTSPSTRLAANSLVYNWRWADKQLAEQSGIGRSTLTVTAPVQYRDAQITVDVSNTDGTLVAEASTVIKPEDPVARIYPNDPLLGPDFFHALSGSYTMNSDEEAFRGIAYFFGVQPALAWGVNGEPASSDPDVTVRTTGAGQGTANLSFSAQTPGSTQSVSLSLPVRFGAKKATNIFGF
jgi:hypothetical protein